MCQNLPFISRILFRWRITTCITRTKCTLWEQNEYIVVKWSVMVFGEETCWILLWNIVMYTIKFQFLWGVDPGYSVGGGGGAKDYACARTLRARSPKSLTAGVQGPLSGPRCFRVLDALECYLTLGILLSILIQNGKQKIIVDQNLRGCKCLLRPPLDPPLSTMTGEECKVSGRPRKLWRLRGF